MLLINDKSDKMKVFLNLFFSSCGIACHQIPYHSFVVEFCFWIVVFFSFFGGTDWEEERSKNQSAFEKKSNRGPIFYLYTLKTCSMRSVCKWRKKLISGEKSTVENSNSGPAGHCTHLDRHTLSACSMNSWTVEIAVPARVL